ncbi:hypothetical protein [Streptacidiphilus fuscans]|uniref:Uncharacterized protein n=1 Tax=Streptacidiphilus fuscans TaxID=2789292 RepID=A0A931B9I2_9ACTN|nr:hypothetical protein [Streptacidiphilus fuscans]MBF9073735.1 hypothetical protein [Streptacidiphilus fuscans]
MDRGALAVGVVVGGGATVRVCVEPGVVVVVAGAGAGAAWWVTVAVTVRVGVLTDREGLLLHAATTARTQAVAIATKTPFTPQG